MSEAREIAGRLWRRNLLIWAGLLALLFLSLGVAYVPMGKLTVAGGIVIAAVKSLLVALLFMQVAGSRPLIRLASIAGLIFLISLFALTLTDVLARA